MEEFSRRIWAPEGKGAQRETKWFYERARGQYADAQASSRRQSSGVSKAENPKPQMLTKTDLAKFENVWDEHPRYVNLAPIRTSPLCLPDRKGMGEVVSDGVNETYFKRPSRGGSFSGDRTDRIGPAWYKQRYRANIVAYTLAVLSELTRRQKEPRFPASLERASDKPVLESTIVVVASRVKDDILRPDAGYYQRLGMAKREACWTRMLERMDEFAALLPKEFDSECLSRDEHLTEKRRPGTPRKLDNGNRGADEGPRDPGCAMERNPDTLAAKRLLTTERDRCPEDRPCRCRQKIPTDKQCAVLLEVLLKARARASALNSDLCRRS